MLNKIPIETLAIITQHLPYKDLIAVFTSCKKLWLWHTDDTFRGQLSRGYHQVTIDRRCRVVKRMLITIHLSVEARTARCRNGRSTIVTPSINRICICMREPKPIIYETLSKGPTGPIQYKSTLRDLFGDRAKVQTSVIVINNPTWDDTIMLLTKFGHRPVTADVDFALSQIAMAI